MIKTKEQKRKRLPIEQLRTQSKIAIEMAKEKNLISKESFIDFLKKDPTNPMLPGMPSYLPYKETLLTSQILMARMAKGWMEKNKKNQNEIDDFDKFFNYCLLRMKETIDDIQKRFDKTEWKIKNKKPFKNKTLAEIFEPMRSLNAAKRWSRFITDSFAVAVCVKRHDSASEFFDWFLNDWTKQLMNLWDKYKSNNVGNTKPNASGEAKRI
jgi:hypothetical protein